MLEQKWSASAAACCIIAASGGRVAVELGLDGARVPVPVVDWFFASSTPTHAHRRSAAAELGRVDGTPTGEVGHQQMEKVG